MRDEKRVRDLKKEEGGFQKGILDRDDVLYVLMELEIWVRKAWVVFCV